MRSVVLSIIVLSLIWLIVIAVLWYATRGN